RHRCQAHDRTVATCPAGAIARGTGVAAGEVPAQRCHGGDTDVEDSAVDGVLARTPPLEVTLSLVVDVPADVGDAVCQRQSHAGVVRPVARVQTVRTASAIAGHGREGPGRLELDRGPEGIAHGEAE